MLDNIKLPNNEEAFIKLARGWENILRKRFGTLDEYRAYSYFAMICSGDGLAVEVQQLTLRALHGLEATTYLNRKGFWALIVQAFCDCYGRFIDFECSWPGATCDVTAYKQSDMFQFVYSENFPDWAVLLLDEAYASYGDKHLCPFSIHQLEAARKDDMLLYEKMLIFNSILSILRSTIERSFGMLVRRFGIFWRPIEFKFEKVYVELWLKHKSLFLVICIDPYNCTRVCKTP